MAALWVKRTDEGNGALRHRGDELGQCQRRRTETG